MMRTFTGTGRNSILFFLISAIVLLILAILILAWTPPISRDALTHHLAAPKLYLNHGKILEIPSFKFSYYPMNIDLLYMIPLYFGNDILPKYIHFLFAILTSLLIFYYLKSRSNAVYGLLGTIFFLSIPIVVKLSITAYVDLGLIFFSTAALLTIFKWIESSFKIRYLMISGVFCGLALGTKYNGLVAFFLIAMFIPFCYSRYERDDEDILPKKEKKVIENELKKRGRFYRAIGYVSIFILIAITIYFPWALRNIIWKDNPVYPLYNNFFSEPSLEKKIAGQKAPQKFSSFAVRKIIYGEKWYEIALIPLRIFFEGKDDDPRGFDGRLNPFLIIWPIFAFIWRKQDSPELRREKMVLFWFSALFLFLVFFAEKMRIRYIGPIIPPLVILSVLGIKDLLEYAKETGSSKKYIQWSAVFGISMMILINCEYITGQFRKIDPISYITGRISREDFIVKHVPEYSAVKFVNDELASDDKVLALFLGKRRYYFDRNVIFGINHLQKIVSNAAGPEMVADELKEKGVNYLIVGVGLFNKVVPTLFEKKELVLLNKFFKNNLNLFFSANGYAVYKLT